MKLDDEFKRTTNQEFKEGDYVFRKIFVRVVIIVLLLIVIIGGISFGYKKLYVDANREIFKHSVTYTETAAQFLSKEYREYNSAESDADRNAIMQYVAERYPNLNANEIENLELRSFYNKCLKGVK